MPDVQPQDTSKPQNSPAIADLAPPGQDTSVSGLVSSLTALDRQKLKTDTDLSNQFNAQSAKDKAIRDEAFRAEGAAAADIPRPWDADKEHRKYRVQSDRGIWFGRRPVCHGRISFHQGADAKRDRRYGGCDHVDPEW